jgi:hypothetical protein
LQHGLGVSHYPDIKSEPPLIKGYFVNISEYSEAYPAVLGRASEIDFNSLTIMEIMALPPERVGAVIFVL